MIETGQDVYCVSYHMMYSSLHATLEGAQAAAARIYQQVMRLELDPTLWQDVQPDRYWFIANTPRMEPLYIQARTLEP